MIGWYGKVRPLTVAIVAGGLAWMLLTFLGFDSIARLTMTAAVMISTIFSRGIVGRAALIWIAWAGAISALGVCAIAPDSSAAETSAVSFFLVFAFLTIRLAAPIGRRYRFHAPHWRVRLPRITKRSAVVAAGIVGVFALGWLATTLLQSSIAPGEPSWTLGAYHPSIFPVSLVDAALGAAATAAVILYVGGSRWAALIGAVLWTICPGRLQSQGSIFWASCLVPIASLVAFFCFDRAKAWSIALSIGLFIIAAFIDAQIVLPLSAIYLAVAARSASRVGIVATAAAAIFVVVAQRFGLPSFVHVQTIVGPSADGAVKYLAGDGSYPWEVLYPSSAGIAGSLARALHVATSHYGDVAYEQVSPGYAVLLVAFLGVLMRAINVGMRSWLFWALGISIALALPSHAQGVPLPSAVHLLEILGSPAADGSRAYGAAVFALVVAAALTLSLVSRYGKAVIWVATAAFLLLGAFDVLPERARSTNVVRASYEDVVQAYHPERMGSVALVVGAASEDPQDRIARAQTKLLGPKFVVVPSGGVKLAELLPEFRRRSARYVMADFASAAAYVPPELVDRLVLPPDVPATPPSLSDSSRFAIPGLDVVGVTGDVVLYRVR